MGSDLSQCVRGAHPDPNMRPGSLLNVVVPGSFFRSPLPVSPTSDGRTSSPKPTLEVGGDVLGSRPPAVTGSHSSLRPNLREGFGVRVLKGNV